MINLELLLQAAKVVADTILKTHLAIWASISLARRRCMILAFTMAQQVLDIRTGVALGLAQWQNDLV
ncbi:MAG: hypothetical protein EBQ96_03890 [Proteobacteria bacterium]|nr:hypothetical protein [Pseudomonadota bacterium]